MTKAQLAEIHFALTETVTHIGTAFSLLQASARSLHCDAQECATAQATETAVVLHEAALHLDKLRNDLLSAMHPVGAKN